jgi:cellulose synthase/poly-beta-1,6-N-acetylglucosamine synthase-like glycosyltransferase
MSMLIEYIIFSISVIYLIVIILFAIGWYKLSAPRETEVFETVSVSVVIACRNEEKNVSALLDSILNQNYPKNKTEIIIVDDHSSDNSIKIIEKYTAETDYLKLFRLPDNKTGKKEAINFGIANSKTDVIITTDADCIASPNWLNTMMNYYAKHHPKMLCGPVTFSNTKSLFSKLQNLEFLSLIGSGAGAIGIRKAIMNNGANLLFEKTLYESCNTKNEYASGDDMFLLLHAKSNDKKNVHFIKSIEAIVFTKSAQTLRDFINQRARWTSKSKAYRDFDLVVTALIVTCINLLLVTSFVIGLFNTEFLKIALVVLIIKSFADLLILIPTASFFKQTYLIFLFPLLQIIYPFYIVFTVILGLTGKFVWKSRIYKQTIRK